MAEQLKDEQDRMLEAMFASEPIADNGFSMRIVKQLRRRLWLRRVTLPLATVLGLLVSFKPLTQLVETLAGLARLLPLESVGGATEAVLGQLPTVVLGGMLIVALMVGIRIIED